MTFCVPATRTSLLLLALFPLMHLFLVPAMPSHSVALPQPQAFAPLSLGAVTPSSWLADQLQLQANGLARHLSHFYANIESSVWVVRKSDTALHERGPYWLNGIVPLARLMCNMNCTSKAPSPLRAQVDRYIDHIMASQDSMSGWLVPAEMGGKNYWGRFNVVMELLMEAESARADGYQDRFATLTSTAPRYVLEQGRRMSANQLTDWGCARGQEFAQSLLWLYENALQGGGAGPAVPAGNDQGADGALGGVLHLGRGDGQVHSLPSPPPHLALAVAQHVTRRQRGPGPQERHHLVAR